MENMISWKSNWKHAALEYQIRELDVAQDISRSAILSRAIVEADSVADWKLVREKLMSLGRMDTPIVASMQAKADKVSSEMLPGIRSRILEDLKDDIERLRTPYLIQLIWVNYLAVLKKKALNVGAEKAVETHDLNAPEIVGLIVEMIIYNRESDADTINEIKNILIKWRANK